MKRALLVCLLSSPALAQTLACTANWTFAVDTALPAQNGISASGTVTIGCSPCAVSSNSQHFGFQNVQLLYANELTYVASGSAGNQSSSLMTSFTYTLTGLLPGTRLVPRLNRAACWCGNHAQDSNLITEDKPAITINPYLGSLSVYRGFSIGSNDAVPTGEVVTVNPACMASPKGNEQVRIKITGAGVDKTTDFPESALNRNVDVTFTTPGTVTVTCSLEPYGSVSNSQTLTVVAASGGTGGGGSGGTGGGSGGGDTQPRGCSSAGGLCVALALAGVLRRRR